MSNLSAFPYIQERTEATPALWNNVYSILSANIREVDLASAVTGSVTSNLSVGIDLWVQGMARVGSPAASSSTRVGLSLGTSSAVADYIQFADTSAARSNYIIGSRVGGTADGLNLWDQSGSTMIVSFSKQSVRFYQNVVGPVFDLGGSLTSTYNAATFGTGSDSTEVRIQAAINQASIDGVPRVYLPGSFLPYNASSVSFIYPVQMIREGGETNVFDVKAYGAAGDYVQNDTAAFQAAASAATAPRTTAFGTFFGTPLYIPPGHYRITSDLTINAASGALNIVGVPRASIIVPDTGVNRTIVIQNAGGSLVEIYGIMIDGANVPTKTGIRIGPPGGVTHLARVVRCYFTRFNSSGGIALQLADAVNITVDACIFSANWNSVQVLASTFDLPTNSHFRDCLFTGSASHSIDIQAGRGITFHKCDIEANEKRGVYVHPTSVGGNQTPVSGLGFSECWFEDNWTSVASQSTSYGLDFDGTGTTRETEAYIRDCYHGAQNLFLQTNGMSRVALDRLFSAPGNTANNIRIGGSTSIVDVKEWSQVGGGDISSVFSFFNSASSISNLFLSTVSGGFQTYAGDVTANRFRLPAGSATTPTLNFSSETSLGFYRSAASTIAQSYGTISLPKLVTTSSDLGGVTNLTGNSVAVTATAAGTTRFVHRYTNTSGALDFGIAGASDNDLFTGDTAYSAYYGTQVARDLHFATAGSVRLTVRSAGSIDLRQNRLMSVRTLAASAITVSAANTNVLADEMVLTIGGASGASLAIHSGGTVYIFNSALSAKAT